MLDDLILLPNESVLLETEILPRELLQYLVSIFACCPVSAAQLVNEYGQDLPLVVFREAAGNAERVCVTAVKTVA